MQSFLLCFGSEDMLFISIALGFLCDGCSVELLSLRPIEALVFRLIGSPAKILCRR
ncbi:hypothetical protein DY000_02005674 [Brassica cretica]|uniref:Uncharacterized protein n=1 Tax=Brassica cretica TaxID=69181 RepID=A0ABQ7C044_BRACR|nr:hypothetical protein DY000_02005674 [Brassica cretica]